MEGVLGDIKDEKQSLRVRISIYFVFVIIKKLFQFYGLELIILQLFIV